MAYDKGHIIARQFTLHGQEATRMISTVFRLIYIRLQKRLFRCKETGIVYQRTIYTTLVRPFYMDELHSTCFQRRLFHQILHHTAVLNLRHPDDRRTDIGQLVCPHLRQYSGHVLQFREILHSVPFHSPVRQILEIVFPLVMNGIEKIFLIIKPNRIHAEFLLLGTCRRKQQHEQAHNHKHSFHKMFF